MPWRECHKMDERLRFVARLLDGEKMAVLCREFEISRKTGYKIFGRYKDCGVDGPTDRTRRPYRHARQLPFQIEAAILQAQAGSIATCKSAIYCLTTTFPGTLTASSNGWRQRLRCRPPTERPTREQ
jgi:transposase